MKKYLAGDVRERIKDMADEQHKSHEYLAKLVGMSPGSFSRFLNGKTAKLNHDAVLRLAREFRVSTDFLLGIINHPDRIDYALDELGLSVDAARKLYTKKIDGAVLSRLLETPGAPLFFQQISCYLSRELAAGIAAQGVLLDKVSKFLLSRGSTIGAAEAQQLKESDHHQLQNIDQSLEQILKRMHKDNELEVLAKNLTTQEFDRIQSELSKPSGSSLQSVTPEQLADAILEEFRSHELASEQTMNAFRIALVDLLKESLEADRAAL